MCLKGRNGDRTGRREDGRHPESRQQASEHHQAQGKARGAVGVGDPETVRVQEEGKDQRESNDGVRSGAGGGSGGLGCVYGVGMGVRGEGAAKVWAKLAGARHTGFAPTLISGAVLNCGGPLSRAPAALASLKLGVGELGGFTGSGTRRLGPPALFPEPGATPPAPAGAAALDSFLERRQKRGLMGVSSR